MTENNHVMMDGRLHVYKREGSRYWQCSAYMNGRNHRATTKEDNIVLAKEYAKYWYMERYVEARRQRSFNHLPRPAAYTSEAATPRAAAPPVKRSGRTFADAAEVFLQEYEIITQGQRSASYVESHRRRLNLHLIPFFGAMDVSAINGGTAQEYRVHRHKTGCGRRGKPSRSSLHHETVTLRLVLKAVQLKKWIAQVPDLSPPYKTSGKITHRAWFSQEEYKLLYKATRERAKHPKKERWRKECENLHDYVLFMANTGLRPDEAARLEYRDVAIVTDEPTGERILEIEVRGKRGTGHCKSMPGAVLPFRRMKSRNGGKPTDLIFGRTPRLLHRILVEIGLKTDRDGNERTAYSLRHTYICMRLMEGADIYQVAKNCRTSVEMIENFYAVHLKNTLDASAINVRKAKTPGKTGARRSASRATRGGIVN